MSVTPSRPRIAFLGLGLMGTGMARRLVGAGFPLTVYNRSAAKAAPFASAGAQVAPTARAAAAQADVIICMSADDIASRSLWLGADGALSGAAPGAVCIDSSTVTTQWIAELAAAALAARCELLDAPVTGSRPQAAAGELCFLVGGSAETLEKVRPVLAVMSRSIVHLGPVGSGALLKLVNNFLCGVQTASLAEGLAIIERSGLDPAQALGVLASGAPGSPIFKIFSARMAARDYTPNFLLRLMAKDLGYARQEGERLSVPMTTAAAAIDVFARSLAAGDGDRDVSAIAEQFRRP